MSCKISTARIEQIDDIGVYEMKVIKTKVYELDELSEDAKEEAREWYRDGALDHDWWDYLEDDAGQIGLGITEFDLHRHSIHGEFTESGIDVARAVVANHGESCETYKTAQDHIADYDVECAKTSEDDDIDTEEIDTEFLRSLLEDYRNMLQKEYEYLLSDESVDDNIRINGYTFTEDGKRF